MKKFLLVIASFMLILAVIPMTKVEANADTLTKVESIVLPGPTNFAEGETAADGSGSGEGYNWQSRWEYYGQQGRGFFGTFLKGNTYTLLYTVTAKEGYDVSQVEENNISVSGGTANIYWYQATYNRWLIRQDYHIDGDKYTVSYNANGGSGTMANQELEEGEITLPACTFTAPEGYEFKSWKIGETEYNAGEKYQLSGPVTMVAQWIQIVKYKVSFDMKGHGSQVADKTNISYNTTITEPTKPVCDGYTFVAWYKDSNLSQLWNFSSDKVTEDTVLYAKWLRNASSVTVTTTAPVAGQTSVVTEGSGDGYTYTVTWEYYGQMGHAFFDKFVEETTYTVLFIVYPAAGYTLSNLTTNDFTTPNWEKNGAPWYQSNYNRWLIRLNYTVPYVEKRNIISTVSFSNFKEPSYQASTAVAGNLTADAPNSAVKMYGTDEFQGEWLKKNSDGTYSPYTKSTFEEGTYKFYTLIEFASTTDAINTETVIKVNGSVWTQETEKYYFDSSWSETVVMSKEYKVEKPHVHNYVEKITPATKKADGKVEKKCACGDVKSSTTIYKISKVELAAAEYTYDGHSKKPAVIVKNSKSQTLKKDTDYTVSYDKGRKDVGKYKVKVTFKGKYYGTDSLAFTINPKGTSIKSLTAKVGGFAVSWGKQESKTTGYQLQYSTSSKFASSKTKTVTISKNTTVSKEVTKLSKGKKYYVRIRTYKTVGSAKFYSDWSKSKSVTTKKK